MNDDEILEKYHELYKRHIDRQVDDYEVFIRSRVIESLYPILNLPLDELARIVNHALDKCSSASFTDKVPNVEEAVAQETQTDSCQNKKRRWLFVLPVSVALTCLAVCAIRFVVARQAEA